MQSEADIYSESEQRDDFITDTIQRIASMNLRTVAQAVESLKVTGGTYSKPEVVALYLLEVPESTGFTRKDVSIFLAELDEDNEEENDLLTAYFQLVSFEGVNITDSLRIFYSELRLVALNNTVRMNRLLFALATAFKATEGDFEGDDEDCLQIYNALMMLNDSLHRKNVRGRRRLTERAFLELLTDHSVEDIPGFGASEMRRMYHSARRRSITDSRSEHSSRSRSSERSRRFDHNNDSANLLQQQQQQQVNQAVTEDVADAEDDVTCFATEDVVVKFEEVGDAGHVVQTPDVLNDSPVFHSETERVSVDESVVGDDEENAENAEIIDALMAKNRSQCTTCCECVVL